ncbi:GNAT family N-acetyltransferase [Luteimonas wenzhouensis]|uniref:GNAT family N-acetyltransferase n=1 Tax=Luteimonas wenzhouensis TaxID=2599615 RepID=A0A5C5TTP8_9GAMM|nr:GNAT family N-acetyltransferase [Luteimonas wenzhouensis]TWT17066.1 GNAT family N-acetyltransferase [Luteimonas wenzhouensis]
MIRRADPADIPALAALVVASGDDGGDPAGLPARLARLLDQATHALFLAEGDNGPCGFAAAEHCLAPGGECVVLTCLAVDAAARRRGLGSQLLAAAEAWARRRGVKRVQVPVPLAHGDAHGFYPALGYEAFDTRRVYRRDLR